ncbi:MAG: SDR family oxidoreductase [Planctomycetota bacterium]
MPRFFDLSGRVALVTGSSTGLGRAMALGLARAGAAVAMNYAHDEARARRSFSELERIGGPCHLVRGDVTDEDSVGRLTEEVATALGPIDVLVCNATPDQPQRPIEDYDWAFYQRMLDFFVKSPYLLTRAVLPGMKARSRGRIVNIGSEVVHRGVAPFSAYVAAKGGQNGWSRAMATELAPFGITVNTISPGWIPVERHENDPPELKAGYLAGIPAGRWGVPEDVAGACVFLASDEAAFITGQNLHVNGGTTVH